MDGERRSDALGGLLLALIGVLVALLASAPRPSPSSLRPPDRPDDTATAVALGWPIPADCSEPAAWAALPGIGPARARALAELAGAGELRAPADLLRVPGIGSKMAARLAPLIRWPPEEED